jgi:hypothetical protein
MKKIFAAVACGAFLTAPVSMEAQQGASGLYLTGGLVYALGSELTINSIAGDPDAGGKFETKSGVGIGVLAGYGFNPKFSLYATISRATQDVKNSTDDLALVHRGVGVRVNIPTQNAKIQPYVGGEVGQRIASGESCGFGECVDISLTGFYFGANVGGAYFVSPKFAVDASLNLGFGSFSDYEEGTFSGDMETDNTMTTRLHIGGSWFPMRK